MTAAPVIMAGQQVLLQQFATVTPQELTQPKSERILQSQTVRIAVPVTQLPSYTLKFHSTTFLANDSVSPYNHEDVNFDDLIEEIDPRLWNAICMLTRSTTECRGTSKATDPRSSAYQINRKHVDCF